MKIWTMNLITFEVIFSWYLIREYSQGLKRLVCGQISKQKYIAWINLALEAIHNI